MEATVVEEHMVALHILLQELASNSRGILSDPSAEDARVCHGRQFDSCGGCHIRNGTEGGFGEVFCRFHSSTPDDAHQLAANCVKPRTDASDKVFLYARPRVACTTSGASSSTRLDMPISHGQLVLRRCRGFGLRAFGRLTSDIASFGRASDLI